MPPPQPIAKKNPPIGRGQIWAVVVVFLCSAAIGLAGFAKIKLDESTLRFAGTEQTSPPPVATPDAPPTTTATPHPVDHSLGLIALTQTWSTLLVTLAWLGFLFSAVTAVVLALQSRDTTPAAIDSLKHSVSALAQGDLTTRIWGTERRDSVGDLARALDAVRVEFSQMPDISLISDQGKTHVRFDGASKPLFQALITSLSQNADSLQHASNHLTTSTTQQHDVITLLSSRVEAILNTIEQRGLDSDRVAKDSLAKVMTSAQHLRHAQEHAADQLNRIVPFLQERAQGLSEMAHITGKHLAQALQSITMSERGLATSAAHSEQAIQKLSSTADSLSERLFGAVNLLQASGKVLAETTEQTQSKLSEAIGRLDQGLTSLSNPPDLSAHIDQKLDETTSATQAALNEIKNNLATLGDTLATLPTTLASPLSTPSATHVEAAATDASVTSSTMLDHLTRQMAELTTNITTTFDSTLIKTLSQIVGTTLGDALDERLSHQHTTLLTKIEGALAATLSPTASGEAATTLADTTAITEEILNRVRLDTTLLRHDITATFDQTLVKTLSHIVAQTITDAFGEALDQKLAALPFPPPAQQPQSDMGHEALLASLRQQWFQMAGQIEANRASLEQAITAKLQEWQNHATAPTADPTAASAIPSPALLMIEQQTAILTELVAAMAMLDKNIQILEKKLSGGVHRVA